MSNEPLEKKIAEQGEEIRKIKSELHAMQLRLMESEKLAMVGQLTAGILHEIQNPLNFVNNFSELNAEHLQELDGALNSPETEKQRLIIKDLLQNTEKISHHGKRAESIVRNMLMHTRKSAGQKTPTDINALAGEYMRLSFHGIKVGDKARNAAMHINLGQNIDKVNILVQDVGRMLLNLFNNAFYAVYEKAKTAPADYQPAVVLTTAKEGDNVIITISDNGNGIPKDIMDDIFVPFFTTKPEGLGTGLGLSLSAEVAKEHGGKIEVRSVEGEGSRFTVTLPVK